MCGEACSALQTCVAGMCESTCEANESICGDACVDTSSDTSHCGECGVVCPTGASDQLPVCVNGTCDFTPCPTDQFDLNGQLEDGCECIATASEDLTCDGVDDDCDVKRWLTVTHLESTTNHTAFCALRADGSLWAGDNFASRLGAP